MRKKRKYISRKSTLKADVIIRKKMISIKTSRQFSYIHTIFLRLAYSYIKANEIHAYVFNLLIRMPISKIHVFITQPFEMEVIYYPSFSLRKVELVKITIKYLLLGLHQILISNYARNF